MLHPVSPSKVVAKPKRILIIDDNEDAAISLAKLMDFLGHTTCTMFSGSDAVGAAEQFRPDVVLLDIGLPKSNGYEVARKLRECPWAKDILIIAITGWSQPEDHRKSLEAGFDHHMAKPADLNELLNLISHE